MENRSKRLITVIPSTPRKARGSIIVDDPINDGQGTDDRRPHSQLNQSVGDYIRQMWRGGHGDVVSGPSHDPIQAYITSSDFIMLSQILGSMAPKIGISPEHLIGHFLTLALQESGLNKNAQSDGSSAAGILQITDDTYKDLVANLPTFISMYQLQAFAKQGKVVSKNHPLILAALLGFELDRIKKHWHFTEGQGWVPRTDTAGRLLRNLKPSALQYLKDMNLGRQLLLTLYHTNGLYKGSGKGVFKLSYSVRFEADPQLFRRLLSQPDQLRSLTRTSMMTADVSSMRSNVAGRSDVLESNKKRLGKIASRYSPVWLGSSALYKSTFRSAERPRHNGLDLRADHGQPVFAPFEGVVVTSKIGGAAKGNSTAFGKLVDIEKLGSKIQVRLAHLSQVFVDEGELVKQGQVIGLAGTAGTGPHVHVEYFPNPPVRQYPLTGQADPLKTEWWGRIVNRKGR